MRKHIGQFTARDAAGNTHRIHCYQDYHEGVNRAGERAIVEGLKFLEAESGAAVNIVPGGYEILALYEDIFVTSDDPTS